MNYNNTLYLNDHTIYYKTKKIDLPVNVINNSYIYLPEQFINILRKNLTKRKYLKKIYIICHENINKRELNYLKTIFLELYFKVEVILEKDYINIEQPNTTFLINGTTLNFYYLDQFYIQKTLNLDINNLNFDEISYVINHRISNKNVILVGFSKEEIIKINLKTNKYYYVKNLDKFFLNNTLAKNLSK